METVKKQPLSTMLGVHIQNLSANAVKVLGNFTEDDIASMKKVTMVSTILSEALERSIIDNCVNVWADEKSTLELTFSVVDSLNKDQEEHPASYMLNVMTSDDYDTCARIASEISAKALEKWNTNWSEDDRNALREITRDEFKNEKEVTVQ